LDLKQEQVLGDQECEFLIEQQHRTNNQLISTSQLWTDSCSLTNYENISQALAVTSPSHSHTYKTANPLKCDQLIDSWTALPSQEPSGSANNSVGRCTITIPALVEIGDSGQIENEGDIINETDIMMDFSSFTPFSCGVTAWTANSHSNITGFTDVYLGSYNTHKGGFGIQEDYARLEQEKTARQSCPPLNSRFQFSAPAITWADVDQYSNVQSDQGDCQDRVILINDEVNLDRGVEDGHQWDGSTVPNKEAKGTPSPTILGRGGRGKLDLECEGEAEAETAGQPNEYLGGGRPTVQFLYSYRLF